MEIRELRNSIERKKGQKQQIESDIQACEKRKEGYEEKKDKHEEAREVLNEIVKQLHKKLKANVSELSSLAMEAVLDEPYKLTLKFVRRRNKMECDIRFEWKGYEIQPKFGGGGAMDIASFSLMVASWSMRKPQLDNVLLLDEPFKNLKGEKANEAALKMIKEIASQPELNLQIIMISDERIKREKTVEAADRLYEIVNKDGVSQVKLEK